MSPFSKILHRNLWKINLGSWGADGMEEVLKCVGEDNQNILYAHMRLSGDKS